MRLELLLRLAGVGQLALAAASLAIPRVLGWREETGRLSLLTGRVFWLYAAYIWGFNVSFGLLSLLAPGWLLTPSPLAAAVSGFIAAYWGIRLVAQFAWFGPGVRPPGARYRLVEAALVGLFVYLAGVFAAAFVHGLRGG